jgi:VanZ family protein
MADSRSAGAHRMVKKWLPVILWVTLIYVFSTDLFSGSNTAGILLPLFERFFPGISPHALAQTHFTIRKLGHFGAYFILALLVMSALREENNRPAERRHIVFAAMFVTLYAISDEFHQSFVPSRSASIVDVLIDISGGICGIYWSHRQHPGKTSR